MHVTLFTLYFSNQDLVQNQNHSAVPRFLASLMIDLFPYRAFSDLFGKFLVPMKLGKKIVILGKNMTILGKNSAFFSKIGKVNLLNWDFSGNWECSRSIGNFFSQLGKNLVPETRPSFV